MRQIVLNLDNGKIEKIKVPIPNMRKNGFLVKNYYSAMSLGTESQLIQFARKNAIKKALDRPDLLRELIKFAKSEGFLEAYRQARARLDIYFPLGYSSVGEIIKIGEDVDGFRVGDIVACCGEGFASHSEIISGSPNMCVLVPKGVNLREAAFSGLGAIVINALRLARIEIGEKIAVIGTGLLGLIAIQILKNMGVLAVAMDINPTKLKIAKELGANFTIELNKDDYLEKTSLYTNGKGFDKVIIFAATKSNKPIEIAAEIAREKGKIVVPGLVGLRIPRREFFEKELEFVIPRAFGAGSFDSNYNTGRVDYPESYVTGTVKRNLQTFLELLSENRINLEKIITHKISIEEAPNFYEGLIQGKIKGVIGAIIEYEKNLNELDKQKIIILNVNKKKEIDTVRKVKIGLIGAGAFARGTILPILKKNRFVEFIGVATFTGLTATKVGKKFGFKYATTDYLDLLNDDEINTIIIATRHNLHAKLVTEALESKKHVFVEKPLAMNEEEINLILDAYQRSNNMLMVGFNRRFSKFTQLAKSFISKGEEPIIVNIRANVGKPLTSSWVYDPVEGGGRILSEGCHFIDLAYYLIQSPVERLQTWGLPPYSDYTIEDNFTMVMEFNDGSIANIIYASNGEKSFERERIEIIGNGKICVISNFKSLICKGKKNSLKLKKRLGLDRGYREQFNTFISLIMGKEDNLDLGHSYIYSSLLTIKAKRSLEENKIIRDIDF